jgi:ATP-dependent DNA helicase RecG
MASSLQTLVKILRLEQSKEYQNKAVIGGFGRFAYHWSREAHSQAKTDPHHALVDEITRLLGVYETAAESERPALVEQIIDLVSGHAEAEEEAQSALPPPQPAASAPAQSQAQTPARSAAPQSAPHRPAQEQRRPLPQQRPQPQQRHGGRKSDDDEHEGSFGSREFEASPLDDWFMGGGTVSTPEAVAIPQSVRERRGYAWQQQTPATAESLRGLGASVRTVKGVGETRAEQLERLGANTIWGMLSLFPRKYNDFSRMKPISQLRPDEEITVIGMLEKMTAIPMKSGGKRIEAFLNDGSAALRLNWFNQPWIEQQLKDGETYMVSGKTEQYLGRVVMNAPEMEELDSETLHTGRIVPVYPLTKGLGARTLRNLMKETVDAWAPRLPDYLPAEVRDSADLMDYGDAVSQAHFPDTWQDKEDALHRLAFDELFTLHLAMLYQRRQWQNRKGEALPVSDEWLAEWEASLPYDLTGAQQRAIAELRQDMATDIPMNRLLQGDVGSGKTFVAATAIAMAVASGVQAAIMAPTSILAEQHYTGLYQVFANSPIAHQINIALLTSNASASERQQVYDGLANGTINVVVGTQAIIQQNVNFANLGMAVIDEQHRFGVAQRGSLREKANGGNPHLLVMTATPIPRTLALTLHADLDLSIIDEMPPGREPIDTRVLQPKERERAYSFIRSQVEKGHQAFVIFPLVEDSENSTAGSAVEGYKRLQKTSFPDLRLALIHGRMRADEKESVMAQFYAGEADILISTSVIEVGIDVPNATVMLVEDANRFGLAQLHQLRGRVGRGGHKGYCLLVSDKAFLETDDRLAAMEYTTDGFKLAEIDWQMRGAGDLLGTAQSGHTFGMASITTLMDSRLVAEVQREARAVFERDPELADPAHNMLSERVREILRARESGDIS